MIVEGPRRTLEIQDFCWWLVRNSGNGVRHVNEVNLRRARLVLGLMTTLGESTIPAFIQVNQTHADWPSLRR